jgi:Flp pilus assembly protein TadD
LKGIFSNDWRKIIPLAVAAIGVISYFNSLSVPFLFDDYTVILGNSDIGRLWPPPFGMRMIATYSFRLNFAICGYNTADYHAVNLAIHVAAALFLFGIVRRTMLLPVLRERYGEHSLWLAFAVSAIWVAHPLQTAAVTYICQRYESLMGLFALMTLYFFIRAQDARRPGKWRILTVLACATGMGVKEVMVVMPLVILVYDYLFLSRSVMGLARGKWVTHLALFLTLAVLAILNTAPFTQASQGASPLAYLYTQFGVIVHYLRLAVYPSDLCFDYLWKPATGIKDVIVPGLLLAVPALFTVVALFRKNPAAFPGVWFFLILAPTSSILPVGDAAFEHRMYLPLAAVIVVVVMLGHGLFNAVTALRAGQARFARGARAVELLLLAGIVASLAVATVRRNDVYRSEESLWRDVVGKRQGNARAWSALVSALLKQNKVSEAEACSRRYLEVLREIGGENRDGYRLSSYSDFAAGASEGLGYALLSQGRWMEAVDHFREAIKYKPDNVVARHNLGLALFMNGNADEAEKAVREAVGLFPGTARLYLLMGYINANRGDCEEAIRNHNKAIELDQTLLTPRLELAWLLATYPVDSLRDGERAVRLALSVCEETRFSSFRALDVLAAAYAEIGRFELATDHALRSLDLLHEQIKSDKDSASAEEMWRGKESGLLADMVEMRGRLGLYEKKCPYRATAGEKK